MLGAKKKSFRVINDFPMKFPAEQFTWWNMERYNTPAPTSTSRVLQRRMEIKKIITTTTPTKNNVTKQRNILYGFSPFFPFFSACLDLPLLSAIHIFWVSFFITFFPVSLACSVFSFFRWRSGLLRRAFCFFVFPHFFRYSFVASLVKVSISENKTQEKKRITSTTYFRFSYFVEKFVEFLFPPHSSSQGINVSS